MPDAMPRLASILLSMSLVVGSATAGELLIATDRSSGLSLQRTVSGWLLERGGTESVQLPLPADFEAYALEALTDGWILTGTLGEAGYRHLLLLRGTGDTLQIVTPPAPRSGAIRDNPVPLVEDGRLVGLSWIEGDRFDRLQVRAARWQSRSNLADSWGPVEEVSSSARSDSSRGWSSQLALAGTVLGDGDWLLLWSAFDGQDDEIVWSARRAGRWTPTQRLHSDNRVPDVTPTVVGTASGALAAWSAFDDGHYRLALARFEGGAWQTLPLSTDRGATDPRAFRSRDGLTVIYDSVVPRGVHRLELDASGEILRRRLLPGDELEAASEPAAPAVPPELVYLAFGDSITAGSFDELNLGGYPGRLGPELGCSPGVCSVDNQGVGGEKTGQAVTRIDSVLAAKRYDIMLLMEGTNDIFQNPPISNNTIQFNLETIADKAEAKGVEPLLASIIWFHPDGTRGTSRDDEVADLRNRLIGVTGTEGYSFADPWTPLCPNRPCFDTHYFGGVPVPDPVGHPDASGYDIMSGVFAGTITALPAPTEPTAVSPSGPQPAPPTVYTWDRESPLRASWYEMEIRQSGQSIFSRWYQAADVCNESSCTVGIEGSLPPGNYNWRVRGRNPAGYSLWGPLVSFSVTTPQGPTLTLVSGGCSASADGETEAPLTATISGSGFPPNAEAGIIMAAGSSGFVKGGALCNGAVFEISEPFVLPPTWLPADASGSFTVQISGEECFVQALAVSSCEVSNLLVLP